MKLRKLLICAAALVFIMSGYDASAVPAPPFPVKVKLPDGTTMMVKMTGDEYFMYTTTIDGYNIVMEEDGYYYYAEDAGGRLVSTSVRAGDSARRNAAAKAVLPRVLVGAPSWAAAASKASPLRRTAEQAEEAIPQDVKMARQAAMASGEPFKSLAILVNFQDVRFSTPNPQQAFHNLLNQPGYSYNGSTGSAADYYRDNSNGRFNPQFDVVGPVTVSGPLSDYSWNSGNFPQMIVEAVNLADAEVDFSQYADGSEARGVYIFFAGVPNQTTSIWPHKSQIQTQRLDGVNVSLYACSAEHETSDNSIMSNIGTFCHEFGHVLGWPDFYDTDYEENGTSLNVDIYSLMATGCYNNVSRTPPAFTAMERWMQGWLTPKEFEVSKEYTIKPVSEDDAYIIYTDVENEYFLIEVRSASDANGSNVWDETLGRTLRMDGDMPIMMVYHVDRSTNSVSGRPASSLWNSNQVNAFASHECFKAVRAVRSEHAPEWCYPGPLNVTALSSSLNSEFKAWSGKNQVEEFISISRSGNNMVVNVFNGTAPAEFLTLVNAGEDYAEFEWSTATQAGPFTVELYDSEGARLQQFEVTEKAAVVTMLKAATVYKLTVSASSGFADELQFKTAVSSIAVPHLPFKGTYTTGESLLLNISGITNDIVSAEWTLDGATVNTSKITLTAGKHTITVKTVLADGNEEIYTKTITVQ